MSYILEALKKSQRDRDPDRVPTLPMEPTRVPGPPRSINHWSLSALILAFAALSIAIYGTLGGRWFSSEPQISTIQRSSATESGIQNSASVAQADSRPAVEIGAEKQEGDVASAESEDGKGANRKSSEARLSSTPGTKEPPIQMPASVAPVARDDLPEVYHDNRHTEAAAQDTASIDMASGNNPSPVNEGTPLERSQPATGGQVKKPALDEASAEKTTQLSDARGESPTTQLLSATSDVSEYLRQEADKLRERLGAIDLEPNRKPKAREKTPQPKQTRLSTDAAKPPSPADTTETQPQVLDKRPPRDTELPPDIFRTLPDRKVIVHVYRDSPGERFIIMNSRKMREGDETTEGLMLEKIRPDGAILRFKKHRFFAPR